MFKFIKKNKFVYRKTAAEKQVQSGEKLVQAAKTKEVATLSKPKLVKEVSQSLQTAIAEGTFEVNDPKLLLNKDDPKEFEANVKDRLLAYFESISRNKVEANKKMASIKTNDLEDLTLKFALYLENERKREEALSAAKMRVVAFIAENPDVKEYNFELRRKQGGPEKDWSVDIKDTFKAYCKLVADVEALLGKTKKEMDALYAEVAGINKEEERPIAEKAKEELKNLEENEQYKMVLKTKEGSYDTFKKVNSDYFENGQPVTLAKLKKEVLSKVKKGDVENIHAEKKLDDYNDYGLV